MRDRGEGRRTGRRVRRRSRASRATGVVSGRGIACVCYEGDNGYVAMVAEVDVNQDTGQVHVTRLVVAQDCGPISNPDGMRNQIEGGALQGMSRALGEEVTWDEEKVTSIDWRTYRSLPLGFAVPRIETVLINQPDEEACGAGETAITVVAAAIGNAIFDATGARIREVPFTPERVKAALRLVRSVRRYPCRRPRARQSTGPSARLMSRRTACLESSRASEFARPRISSISSASTTMRCFSVTVQGFV